MDVSWTFNLLTFNFTGVSDRAEVHKRHWIGEVNGCGMEKWFCEVFAYNKFTTVNSYKQWHGNHIFAGCNKIAVIEHNDKPKIKEELTYILLQKHSIHSLNVMNFTVIHSMQISYAYILAILFRKFPWISLWHPQMKGHAWWQTLWWSPEAISSTVRACTGS